MTDVFKLIEEHGLTLHGDIEHLPSWFGQRSVSSVRRCVKKICAMPTFHKGNLRVTKRFCLPLLQIVPTQSEQGARNDRPRTNADGVGLSN